ncbi:citrate synthase [Ileibacterium valens]|uniref:citrate synthase n=1 Tax=Ileibacterium valens TaxID=1862668 RepID=UPI0025728638|nr:citrate synthase [Ileibacterium valens]
MKTLKEIYLECEDGNYIESSLYSAYRVKQGLRNDNGTGVKVGLTRICDVIGYRMVKNHKKPIDGQLIYRGYQISDLVRLAKQDEAIHGYEITAFLLIFGRLPKEDELKSFQFTIKHAFNVDLLWQKYQTTNLLNALQIEILKLFGTDEDPETDRLDLRMEKGLSILSSLPLFVFSVYSNQKITAYPLPAGGFAENILWMARNHKPYTQQEARVMDVLLMLHADHGGGNNSTFANVVISSTGTDIYSCISAAIGSLKGPKHGGAAGKVGLQTKLLLETITEETSDQELEELCEKILRREWGDGSGLIYGIGHAIYTKSDPRCQLIKEECRKLASEKGMSTVFETMNRFEKAAVATMKKVKNADVCANVDFYSGFAYAMLGIDQSLYVPLFAISRCAGWVAHHLENRQSNRKLIRPANIYVGEHHEIFEDSTPDPIPGEVEEVILIEA